MMSLWKPLKNYTLNPSFSSLLVESEAIIRNCLLEKPLTLNDTQLLQHHRFFQNQKSLFLSFFGLISAPSLSNDVASMLPPQANQWTVSYIAELGSCLDDTSYYRLQLESQLQANTKSSSNWYLSCYRLNTECTSNVVLFFSVISKSSTKVNLFPVRQARRKPFYSFLSRLTRESGFQHHDQHEVRVLLKNSVKVCFQVTTNSRYRMIWKGGRLLTLWPSIKRP